MYPIANIIYAIVSRKLTIAKYDWHAWCIFKAGTGKLNLLARWSANDLNDKLHIRGI